MMSELKNRLKNLISDLDCIKYGRFPLASGGTSDYKVECDALFKNQEARKILGKLGSNMLLNIERGKTYVIIGVMSGGYEFGKIVADNLGRKAVGIDPHNGKVYGKVSMPHACWFEDVVTKGGSILKCKRLIGGYPSATEAICIVDRDEGGRANLKENGIELYSIFRRTELDIS